MNKSALRAVNNCASSSYFYSNFRIATVRLTTLCATALLVATMSVQAQNAAVPAHLQNQATGPFTTQPWQADGRFVSDAYTMERVEFSSQGTPVVGNVFTPNRAGRKPAIVFMGPVAFVKEQAPMQYATRLAKEGFVSLVFDPRYHGESGGQPRRLESRAAKVQDLRAAIDYILSRPDVDADRIYLVGICQGANWAMEASTLDARIKGLAVVAGHYLVPETAKLYIGSPEKVEARLSAARAAKNTFDQTGEVEYIPIVSATDSNALLTAPVIRQFYERWADRGAFWNFHGLWENRIARMSELDIWGHQVDAIAQQLKTPTLMVHADRAASGPALPRKLFEQMPAHNKKLVWLGGQNQMQFYEDPVTIDFVVPHIRDFFQTLTSN